MQPARRAQDSWYECFAHLCSLRSRVQGLPIRAEKAAIELRPQMFFSWLLKPSLMNSQVPCLDGLLIRKQAFGKYGKMVTNQCDT